MGYAQSDALRSGARSIAPRGEPDDRTAFKGAS